METIEIMEWLHSAPSALLVALFLNQRISAMRNNFTNQLSDLRRRVSALEKEHGIYDTANRVTPVIGERR